MRLRRQAKSKASSGRAEYVAGEIDESAFSDLARRTLTVLRPVITQAWIDAFSGREWPSDAQPTLDLVIELSKTQGKSARTRMGIDLDLAKDAHLEALMVLAPLTMHAEAWAGQEWVWSVDDTGSSLAACLTDEEFARVGSSLLERSRR